MSEAFIATVLFTILSLTIFAFSKLLRKPKPVGNLQLQKIHVMRLGPFSGQSNSFKGKSVIFSLLLSAFASAEVSIQTLDNFYINDLSENTVTVAKMAEDAVKRVQLGYHIARPHCVPADPYLMVEIPESMAEGSTIPADIIVDKNKPRKSKLYLDFVMNTKSGDRVGWFYLTNYPSFQEAKKVTIKFNPETHIKNRTFVMEGLKNSSYQGQQICNSGLMLRASNKQVKI